MRALTVSSILGAFALVLLPGFAMAQPCGPGRPNACRPPLTQVCGVAWANHVNRNVCRCWCQYPSAGSSSSGSGSYGKAEIHKKNLPQTHPTPSGNMYMRGAAGVRTPAVGVMRRWQ